MSNAEQTLRLLREVERLDREAIGGESASPGGAITASALLEALADSNFNLTAAIVVVRNDA